MFSTALFLIIFVFALFYSFFKIYELTIALHEAKAFIDVLDNEKSTLSQTLEQTKSTLKISQEKKDEINLKFQEQLVQMTDLEVSLNDLKNNLIAKELEHAKNLKTKIESTRKETLKKSRAIIRGQATEHLAPYIIKNTNPKDYRFLGNPIDYICFEGLSDVLDGKSNQITAVRFIDIKTGKSTLNKTQRRVRDAISDSRVTFEVINLDEEDVQNNKTHT